MNHARSIIMILLLAAGLAQPAGAHVTLVYPHGGESFMPGSTVTVAWRVEVPHTQDNWDLYFSPDGGATWTAVALDLPVSQLTYQWGVPEEEAMAGRIRIVQDNQGPDYEDSSGEFAIQATATAIRPPELPAASGGVTTYPNPFTSATTMEVTLAGAQHVALEVFDLQGRRVARLVDGVLAAGTHEVRWEPTGLAGGLYLGRVVVGDRMQTTPLILLHQTPAPGRR